MGLISFAEDTEPTHLEEKMRWKEKPTVSLAQAPKTEKPVKKLAPQKEDALTSLSFEQVNDNADELIELRGAGRYFGVTDPSTGESINAQQELGRICDNCHERGHVRAKCKTVICHKCGVVGDHYETHCPTTIVCSRCGDRGHTWATCTSKTRKQQYCETCDLYSHSNDNCPSIWRSYLTKAIKPNTQLPPTYCYNCGDDMHFGDECPEPRTSRIPNSSGSAFSGNNLPKELRDRYFNKCFGKKTKSFPEPSSRNFSSNSGNGINFHSYGNSSHGNNNYSNRNYGDNGHNNSFGSSSYNNSYNTNSKKRSYQSTESASSRNYEPSRSGFLASKTSGKKSQASGKSLQASRTGVLPSKLKKSGSAKPNRSGVIPRNKKLTKGSMQQLY
ncbi:hypothetical protein METBIDRAFT_32901 [Metschnikowia bicuspidata var. bicuspidata NRRL YB-4993]|uniref:CCHC-type domain-containing protein n=1 Tax=Metschnikowia bicuspidata var. bicuspidata NRRL YB-4993 TaxID=869754 RepID=A0A1A0H796_9ASCO|nr:hypothetical protein METBIDRAFT_32901 [Metschnikowia bicuspidata var. bicuspidata NRRL YB-4993]OBA19850.1 hypothetical protein METBIDRAFT_32901 [Metschnikowia bicuspidata var. bicuspidata NRRL YB-4993]